MHRSVFQVVYLIIDCKASIKVTSKISFIQQGETFISLLETFTWSVTGL